MTRITMTTDREHVTERPRQCGCGIPVLILVDGQVVEDRPSTRGKVHDACYSGLVDLGAGDA